MLVCVNFLIFKIKIKGNFIKLYLYFNYYFLFEYLFTKMGERVVIKY